MNNWNWSIEIINPWEISQDDLKSIFELERDMWSREASLWEYVRCRHCKTIHSKEDVYWKMIERELIIETVSHIERLLWIDMVICPRCNWDTDFLYWKDYEEEIEKRHRWDSVLAVYREIDSWEVLWFFDWYRGKYAEIFAREFDHYYWEIWEIELKRFIEQSLQIELPEYIFLSSALWLHQKQQSIFITYYLMKAFYEEVLRRFWEIDWIYESVLWTNTHAIYEATWAIPVWIPRSNLFEKVSNTNWWRISDIFVHPNVAEQSVRKMSLPVKSFIKENRKTINSIVH